MGIKSNYTKCIRKIAGDDIFKPTHISEFAFKKIAIDLSLYVYKFKAAMGERWLSGILNMIKCFRINIVHPVFIFDGKPPIEKQEEQDSRKEGRAKLEQNIINLENDIVNYHNSGIISDRLNKLSDGVEFDINKIEETMLKKHNQVVRVCKDDFNMLKELFDIMKIPYYTSPTEAEKLCSKLCIDGLVAAVLSDDTDVIAYKSPITICKLNTASGGCFSLNHKILLERLKLTDEQFLDHCIMCGTDYNKNIPGVGSLIAYKHILAHGSIEGIQNNTSIDISNLDHHVIRKLFTEFEDNHITNIPFSGIPDVERLAKFFFDNTVTMNFSYYISAFENKHITMK